MTVTTSEPAAQRTRLSQRARLTLYILLAVFAIVYPQADITATWYALAIGRAREENPIMAPLLSQFGGMLTAALIHLALSAAVIAFGVYCWRRGRNEPGVRLVGWALLLGWALEGVILMSHTVWALSVIAAH